MQIRGNPMRNPSTIHWSLMDSIYSPWSICLGPARLGSACLVSTRVGSTILHLGFGSAQLGSARVGARPLAQAQLVSAGFDCSRLGSACLARLGSGSDSVFGLARLGSARARALARLVLARTNAKRRGELIKENVIHFFDSFYGGSALSFRSLTYEEHVRNYSTRVPFLIF